jgi:hypothetical protein
MEGIPLMKVAFLLVTVLFIGISMPCIIQKSYADSLKILHEALPEHIEGWRAEPGDRFFDDETIFDYINGTGEVYRAYNMLKCLSRRYINPHGPPIVLDIFYMGSSEDAFGVFTHDQDGETIQIGQGGLYRHGWMRFWKDRFFVSIYAEEETAAAQRSVKELGKAVASLITAQGSKPGILRLLPLEGLQPRSVRYLHNPVVLNYHFYLSNENILNLGPHTDAALAEYQRGEEFARLLLVLYPNERDSTKAYARLLRHYLPEAEAKRRVVLLENGKWSGATVKGKLLAAIFDAHSRGLAEELLREIMETSTQD